jgi:hypothetical protein
MWFRPLVAATRRSAFALATLGAAWRAEVLQPLDIFLARADETNLAFARASLPLDTAHPAGDAR